MRKPSGTPRRRILRSKGKHRQGEQPSRLRRVATITGGLMALAVVAWALVTAIGGITGTADRGEVQVDALLAQVANGSDCDTAVATAGDVAFTWTGFVFGGEHCSVQSQWQNNSDVTVRLQGASAPSGATVTFDTLLCGLTIAPGASTGQPSGSGDVDFTITITDGTGDIVFDPETHGLLWVRDTDWLAGSCPA